MNSLIRLTLKRYVKLVLFLSSVFLPAQIGIAQPLGRVFYTPQQRIELNELQQNQPGADDPHNSGNSTTQNTIRYNGLVRRSGGRTTAWINGQRLDQAADRFENLDLYLRGPNLIVDGRNGRAVVGPGEEHQLREDTLPETMAPASIGLPTD